MSGTKQYPTRMHEVLGVEPGERFTINEEDFGFAFRLNEDGYLMFDDDRVSKEFRITYGLIRFAIMYGIIRKPRLTEEQVAQLKALVTLGFRWLFFTHATANDSWLYATSNKPTYAELEWDGYVGWFWSGERLRIKGSPLNDLERVCADAPLDIVVALKAAGVEVE